MNSTQECEPTIGLIGGMSWHSTLTYYRIINESIARARGGHSSARIALQSVDFADVRECQVAEDWDRAAALLVDAGARCAAGGASVVAICTNLMHKVAPEVEASLRVPVLHIADAVGQRATEKGWGAVAVLGTRWVMEESFYSSRLARHGVGSIVPSEDERREIDRIIWDELTHGVTTEASRRRFVAIIEDLASRGAQAVVLACTEIGLLVGERDSPLPVIDSAEVHALALADSYLTALTGGGR